MNLGRLLTTISYVTALPTGIRLNAGFSRDGQPAEEDLAGLTPYLPAAGLLIGTVLLAGSGLLEQSRCASLVHGALLTTAWLCLTGGLHFDGLMDTADGIFSHRSRERMLEIMQDSRVGNFGVLTGVTALLLKFAAITSLLDNQPLSWAALLLIPAWSRYAEVYAIVRFPYAREEGKGKIFHETSGKADLLTAALLPAAAGIGAAFLSGPYAILVVSGATIAAGIAASHWVNRHLAGQTGDTYGAVVEIAECGGLILSVMALARV